MKRTVKVFKKIDKIKDIWDKLFLSGSDMTPYQNFEWNKNVQDVYKSNTFIFINYYIRYFVCYKDGNPCVIAPLVIPKKTHKGSCYIQLLGEYTKSGALNFIYGDEVKNEDFRFLIEYIKNSFDYEIRFYEIGNYSMFNVFLEDYDKASLISKRICVKSNILPAKEENFNALSKSVRQTIRTSNNRLEKDGISYKIDILKGHCLGGQELAEINALFLKRNIEWGYTDKKADKNIKRIKTLRKRIINTLFKNKDAFINYSGNNNFIVVKCIIDNKLAGYFYAILDNNGYCIVPTLAIDSDFGKYNPGLLMIYEFLCYGVDNGIRIFDLSRGDEPYKSRYLPEPVKYYNKDYRI